MYVCICNALTERDVAAAVAGTSGRPAEVFAACRCRAQCGTCVRRMLDMIRSLEPSGVNRPVEELPQAA